MPPDSPTLSRPPKSGEKGENCKMTTNELVSTNGALEKGHASAHLVAGSFFGVSGHVIRFRPSRTGTAHGAVRAADDRSFEVLRTPRFGCRGRSSRTVCMVRRRDRGARVALSPT